MGNEDSPMANICFKWSEVGAFEQRCRKPAKGTHFTVYLADLSMDIALFTHQ